VPLVAAGEPEHGAQMARFGGVETFRRRESRAFGDDEIRLRSDAVRKLGHVPIDDDMPRRSQCLDQRSDILAIAVGDQQPDVQWQHAAR